MPLTHIVSAAADRQAEMRRRHHLFDEKTVTPGAVADFEPNGWAVAKVLKTGVKIRKERSGPEILENRFWCCLFRLGYPELNVGRHFRIPIGQGPDAVTKQIDVFAKDEETVIIAECKTAEDYRRKSIQKDLGEFHANKRGVADAVRRHYGRDFKPKIIWMFVVSNLSLTQEDRARAKEYAISIITDRELVYFEEIAKALEGAARQQFKAEYLSGQKIPALEDTKLPATRIKIGGHVAYVFTAKASDVLRRAFVNHRDLKDPTTAPTYQRLVNPNRLGKISGFLNDGGFFPNSILLNFQQKPRFDLLEPSAQRDIQFGHVYLPDKYKSLRVIDGQHRLYGCAVANLKQEPTLIFVAFEAISATEEALQFAVINKEQQKVQKKLLDDLEGDLNWDSDHPAERLAAVASRAVDLMNANFGGPFEDKVVSPGLKASDDRPLTLPEVKKAIVSAGLIGRLTSRDNVAGGPFLVLRKGDIDNTATLDRLTDGLNSYFKIIESADPDRWANGRAGRLCNNFGVPGHIRLLGEIIRHIERVQSLSASELSLKQLFAQIASFCAPVVEYIRTTSDDEIERRFNVSFGSGGVRQYYFALSQIVNAQIPEFQPTGFQEWMSEIGKDEQLKADRDAKWIQENVHRIVVDKLKELYGPQFFDIGISSKEMKLRALEKRMSEETITTADGPEKFLDFLDLKRIVEQKDNWPHFESMFSIRLPDQKKGIAKYVHWFDEINRIRRVSAHPYQRAYGTNDVTILSHVIRHLSAFHSDDSRLRVA